MFRRFSLSGRNRSHPIADLLATLEDDHAAERWRLEKAFEEAEARTKTLMEQAALLEAELAQQTAAVGAAFTSLLESQRRMEVNLRSAMTGLEEQRKQTAAAPSMEQETLLAQLQFLQSGFAAELQQLVQRYRAPLADNGMLHGPRAKSKPLVRPDG